MRIILNFMKMKVPATLCVVAAIGCGEEDGDPQDLLVQAPSTYTFESRFQEGASSVSYSGQTMRLVLIGELVGAIRRITDQIDQDGRAPAAGEIERDLEYYFEFDSSVAGGDTLEALADPNILQKRWDDISTEKDLVGKIAGNDPVGQHEDWSSALIGWGPRGTLSPEGLVRTWFAQLDQLAVARSNGNVEMGPNGAPVAEAFVTGDGLDLAQLVEKFLLGAVAYSQGTDDYLDSDLEDKGLNSSTARDGDALYSSLEHQWDEGFGYFGAARDYLDYTDDEIASAGGRDGWAQGRHDTNSDGFIDLRSEMNFGASVNAAKRDRGAVAATDYTEQAMQAFLRGRAIITQAGDRIDAVERAALLEARDRAVDAWERAIAATAVHYFNDVLQDMNTFGTDDYSFLDHAKHWSELKGFALSLQFNPFSQVSDEDLERLHDLVGTRPVLPNAEASVIQAYRTALVDARQILGDAYGFDAANLGDANGEGGW